MGKYVLWLGKIEDKDISLVGTKVFQLNTLYSNNFAIPEGFVITTDAYTLFLNQLSRKIDEQLSDVSLNNKLALEQAAARVQRLILSSNLPIEIMDEIMNNYDKMNVEVSFGAELQGFDFLKKGDKANIAVRTSSFSERSDNLTEHEFISFVNVKGVEQLRRAILGCYASIFSTSNLIERLERNIHYSKIKSAIFIQNMVSSDKSGVIYSTSPNKDGAVEIRSVWGLGKTLQDFRGDIYFLDKDNNRILDVDVEKQDWGYYGVSKAKLVKRELGANKALQQKLDASDLVDLGLLANELERKYGRNLEIEFAFDETKMWIISIKLGDHLREIPKTVQVPKMENKDTYGHEESSYEQKDDWIEISKEDVPNEMEEQSSESDFEYSETPQEEVSDEIPEELKEVVESSYEPDGESSGSFEEESPREFVQEVATEVTREEPELNLQKPTFEVFSDVDESEVSEVSEEVTEDKENAEDVEDTWEQESETTEEELPAMDESVEEVSQEDTESEEPVEEAIPEVTVEPVEELTEEDTEEVIESDIVEVEEESTTTPEEPFVEVQTPDRAEFESKLKDQLKRYSNLYPHARSALEDFAQEVLKIFNDS